MSVEPVKITYTRPWDTIVFLIEDDRLLEVFDDHARITFQSPVPGDLVMRMEHRDEVLRKAGFVPDGPWRNLFPDSVDTNVSAA